MIQADDRPKKAQQILDGARSAFLELGYEGTSVDEIARRAKVSKGTLYAHFPDKAGIFGEVVREAAESNRCWLEQMCELEPEGDTAPERAKAAISEVVNRFVGFLVQETRQSLYRIVLAESERFPELGRSLHAHGPGACHRYMTAFMAQLTRNGTLQAWDAGEAARVLLDLCDGDMVRKRRFGFGLPSEEEIRGEVETVTKIFLRLYGPSTEVSG